jgi:hypothetical protein
MINNALQKFKGVRYWGHRKTILLRKKLKTKNIIDYLMQIIQELPDQYRLVFNSMFLTVILTKKLLKCYNYYWNNKIKSCQSPMIFKEKNRPNTRIQNKVIGKMNDKKNIDRFFKNAFKILKCLPWTSLEKYPTELKKKRERKIISLIKFQELQRFSYCSIFTEHLWITMIVKTVLLYRQKF